MKQDGKISLSSQIFTEHPLYVPGASTAFSLAGRGSDTPLTFARCLISEWDTLNFETLRTEMGKDRGEHLNRYKGDLKGDNLASLAEWEFQRERVNEGHTLAYTVSTKGEAIISEQKSLWWKWLWSSLGGSVLVFSERKEQRSVFGMLCLMSVSLNMLPVSFTIFQWCAHFC